MLTRKEILREQNLPLHAGLFLGTLLSTLWAGAFWVGRPIASLEPDRMLEGLQAGLPYSFSLLLFLTVHEFGHFFAALFHRIRTTLPYYIPVPPLPFLLSLGTLGAVIKIRDRIPNTTALFDTGIAGPLGGFVVALGLLLYGFLHLPQPDYLYGIHPEYLALGGVPAVPPEGSLVLGKNLLWLLLELLLPNANLPPMSEMYHYPVLFAGWIGTFVTALNLIPVGQLDGGHITYALFGRTGHRRAARLFLALMLLLGLPWLIDLLALSIEGIGPVVPLWMLEWSWPGWLFWGALLSTLLGTDHPPTRYDHPLGKGRRSIGWAGIVVFILTFTPVPFTIT